MKRQARGGWTAAGKPNAEKVSVGDLIMARRKQSVMVRKQNHRRTGTD